ncbi:MAG: hypothetical protein DRI24_14530 [Deltaproteobacteria bacterium]|nr:MAG: hypothetical protein DRI24_14530 [Deltaproteobacteria bacterium]
MSENIFDQFDAMPKATDVPSKVDEKLPDPFGLAAPQHPVDFSFTEMVTNVPSSAYGLGEDIMKALLSPKKSALAVGALMQSTANKMGRFAAEVVQGVDIEPMPEHSEAAADAVGAEMVNRYGSIDALKRTAMEDPVGMGFDLSGAGGVLRQGARTAGNVAKAATKAAIPEGVPRKLYDSSAKFSTTLSQADRGKLIDTALKEGILPSGKGVVKVQNRIDILNTQLDDLVVNSGGKVPVNAIFQHLSDLRRTKGGVRLGSESDLAAIDKIAGQFHESLKGKKYVTPEELQFFKTQAYKDINWDAKRMTGTPIKEETYKALARGAKDAIVKELPEAEAINKALGDLYGLQPHLSRAAGRIDNRNLMSINAPLRASAGAQMAGIEGGVMGLLSSFATSPKNKARLAIALDKVKRGDNKWLGDNMHKTEVALAISLIDKMQASPEDQEPSQ